MKTDYIKRLEQRRERGLFLHRDNDPRSATPKAIDPNLILAVEFGFKGAEKGWNLDMTLSEFKKAMTA